jgi:prevent-host-death family protein
MRKAGIREARQDLTSLLDDVRKGREVVIAHRGRPVAKLVPIKGHRPFPDLRAVRTRMRGRDLRLSQAVVDAREDR